LDREDKHGIIDSVDLMRSFYYCAKENGVAFVFGAEIINIDRTADGYQLGIQDADSTYSMTGTVVVNAAGLFSDRVAQLAGIDIEKNGCRLHHCKGEYCSGQGKTDSQLRVYS
jgi:L-2-hydroxyglutarate oxidase LhgO